MQGTLCARLPHSESAGAPHLSCSPALCCVRQPRVSRAAGPLQAFSHIPCPPLPSPQTRLHGVARAGLRTHGGRRHCGPALLGARPRQRRAPAAAAAQRRGAGGHGGGGVGGHVAGAAHPAARVLRVWDGGALRWPLCTAGMLQCAGCHRFTPPRRAAMLHWAPLAAPGALPAPSCHRSTLHSIHAPLPAPLSSPLPHSPPPR